MTKAKNTTPPESPELSTPIRAVHDIGISHESDASAYHADQLARLGVGACEVCGKPVDAKPEWTKTSQCTSKFHNQQFEATGAGACSACGQNVAN